MTARERCDACRGEGVVMVSEWADQYDCTHASYDTCPGCGGEGEIEVESDDSGTCHKCNDTGYIALRASDASYAGPGPVPEDAKGYVEVACECRREDNFFQRLHDSDKAWSERNGGQRDE